MYEKDELRLYRGHDYFATELIPIRTPLLSEICDYGESAYFGMIKTLCSVGVELCWQLEEAGIKFDEISDFHLFSTILRNNFTKEQTKIIFGDVLDFSKMKLVKDEESQNIMLEQTLTATDVKCSLLTRIRNKILKKIGKTDADLYGRILISESVYYKIVGHLRSIHGLKRDDRIAGTASCRRAFIEDAKMEYEEAKNLPQKSTLLPLISTMVNIEGFKRNDENIWSMNIYAFMDSVKRIGKIRNAQLLLQSGYSGFGIDLSKLKNKEKELNYMGELD